MFKAQRYLTQVINAHAKGKGIKGLPKVVYVSPWMFELIESEMISLQRSVSYELEDPKKRSMCFRTSKLMADKDLAGFKVRFES